MADTLSFDLVAPERAMASGAASMVIVPGALGDIGVMPGHAPLITTLRPGVVAATIDGAAQRFVVFGGFAEIGPDRCAVLADDVMPIAELTTEAMDARIKAAESQLEAGDAETRLARAQRLNDLHTLRMHPPAA